MSRVLPVVQNPPPAAVLTGRDSALSRMKSLSPEPTTRFGRDTTPC